MELQDRLGQREHDENTSKEKFLKEKISRHALSLSDRECGKNNTPFPFWRERESRPLFTVSQLLSSKILFFFCWVKFQKNTFNSAKLPVVNPNQCVLCLRSVRCVRDVQKKLSYWLPTNPSFPPSSLPPLSVLYPSFLRGAVSGTSTFPLLYLRFPINNRAASQLQHVECCRQRVLLSDDYHRTLLSMLSICFE